MDVRTPDLYRMETLVDPSVQTTVDDFEKVRLLSLEEAHTQCEETWNSFQPVLDHLKRIGKYDKTIQDIYDVLSILLYKYAYHVKDTLTEEAHEWIETHLKTIRIQQEERDRLSQVFMLIRFNEK
jgi:hypothetical protein